MNASGLKAFNQDLRKCEGTAAIMMKTMIMITTIRMIIFMVIRA